MTAPANSRSALRRLFHLAAWLIAGTILVLGLGAALTRTSTFRAWLHDTLVSELRASVAGEISLGAIDGDLFQTLVLTDLRVTSDGATVLAVPRATLTYDLLALFHGTVALTRIEVTDPHIHLQRDERGWNVSRLIKEPPAPPQQGPGWRVVIDRFALSGGTLDVSLPNNRYEIRDLQIDGSARISGDGEQLTIDRLVLVMPHRGLRLARGSCRVKHTPDGSLSVDALQLETLGSSIRGSAYLPVDSTAPYEIHIDVPRLSRDEVQQLTGAPAPPADFSANLHVHGPASAVTVEGQVKSAAGGLALTGDVDVAATPSAYDLRLAFGNLNIAALLGLSAPQSDITGTATVKGTGLRWPEVAAQIGLTVTQATVGQASVSQAAAQGTIDHQNLLATATAASASGQIAAKVSADLKAQHYALHLSAERFDPARLIARADLAANLNVTLTASGTGFAPATARVEAHVAMTPSQIGAVQIDSLVADFHTARGELTVDQLRLRSNTADVRASGTIGLVGPRGALASAPTGALHYTVDAADLAPLARMAGLGPLGGTATLSGSASGTLQALDLHATAAGQAIDRAAVHVAALKAEFTATQVGSVGARASITARLRDVTALGTTFADTHLAAHWVQESGTTATAQIDVTGRYAGSHHGALSATATVGEAERRVVISQLRFDIGDETWRSEGEPVITERGARVHLRGFRLRSQTGALQLEGEAGTRGTQELTLHVANLGLGMLAPLVQPEVAGRLSGSARLHGTAPQPALDLVATIAQPRVGAVAYEQARVRARIADGKGTLQAQITQSADRLVKLDAALPVEMSLAPARLAAGRPVSGTLHARDIDLAFLAPLVPQISDLGGTLAAELAITGTVDDLRLRGPVTLANGHARVKSVGITYAPIELQAQLDGAVVTVERIRVVSGDGLLTGRGTVTLQAGGATTDVRLTLRDFPFLDTDRGEGAVSGWLRLGGTTAAPVVEGDLETKRLVLHLPERTGHSVSRDETITVIGPGAAPPPTIAEEGEPATESPEAGSSLLERVTLHVQVTVQRNAWLRRSDANIELRGSLSVRKKPHQPLQLVGEIDVVRGWYAFQGKTFDITEGQVTFSGQTLIPMVHVVAQYQVPDYKVILVVGGTLAKPTLNLESEPPLSQADILSVLLFGKPASALTQKQSAGLQQQAVGIAAGYAAGELGQSVANALGLDNLRVVPATNSTSGTAVSLGKYVSEDIFVSLTHTFSVQSIDQLQVEYFVTPRWSLQTSTDTLGESGIDLFWHRRY